MVYFNGKVSFWCLLLYFLYFKVTDVIQKHYSACRHILAVLQLNENRGRLQTLDRAGEPTFSIKYPKFKHSGFTIRMVSKQSTYGTFNKIIMQ